jgi:hypothetical protein
MDGSLSKLKALRGMASILVVSEIGWSESKSKHLLSMRG